MNLFETIKQLEREYEDKYFKYPPVVIKALAKKDDAEKIIKNGSVNYFLCEKSVRSDYYAFFIQHFFSWDEEKFSFIDNLAKSSNLKVGGDKKSVFLYTEKDNKKEIVCKIYNTPFTSCEFIGNCSSAVYLKKDLPGVDHFFYKILDHLIEVDSKEDRIKIFSSPHTDCYNESSEIL